MVPFRLNPATKRLLAGDVRFRPQDGSGPWPLLDASLDIVFTRNFFEHLPDKQMSSATLIQARRCLNLGGKLIAMGPKIKYVPGAYWDFWDHYLPLTELSLSDGLRNRGFDIEVCHGRFLPYTMVNAPRCLLIFLRAYLPLPAARRLLGKQFLVIAIRNQAPV